MMSYPVPGHATLGCQKSDQISRILALTAPEDGAHLALVRSVSVFLGVQMNVLGSEVCMSPPRTHSLLE